MNTLLKVSFLLLIVGMHSPALAQAADGEAQIKRIAANWERAWNKHDMKLLAGLFTEDADFVNVGAKHWRGRKEIQEQHTARLSQFLESTYKTKKVTIHFLKPDIALVHVDWALTGDKEPDGTPRQSREGVFTWVVVKQGETWRIRAAQNTNVSNLATPAIPKRT